MNRTILSTGEGLRSFDFISFEHDVLTGLAQLAADLLGSTATLLGGFAATPTAPASLTLNLAAGSIYQLADADATAGGAIPQDLTQIVQQGQAAAQQVTLVAPSTAGQSQWSLIQAQFAQVDQVRANDPNGGNPPFYNATNPNQPAYNPVNTERAATVTIAVVKGAAATTGSEVPPQPTTGWVPLYLVDLAYGQTQITQAEILVAAPSVGANVPSTYPRAPFLQGLMRQGQFAPDVGAANAYVVALVPPLSAHVAGMPIRVQIANTNTGAATLNDGAGVLPITHTDGSPLNAGELPGGGIVTLTCSGTEFQLESPAPPSWLLNTYNPELGPLPPSLTGSAPGGAKTASWTVGGELQLKTALGGQPFLINNQVLDFNGANVGINGMDTGATPVSADLNFYAAYDPSTGAIGVFGTTQCHGPVYTGASAPAGFTATRRISAVVTDGSGNVQLFKQSGRSIVVPSVNVLAAGTATAWTSVSLDIIVPAAAVACRGWIHAVTSSGNNTTVSVAADASGSGGQTTGLGAVSDNGLQTTFGSLPLATPQTLWYETTAGESTTGAINIAGYDL